MSVDPSSSNVIGESSKSQLDDFYRSTQESLEKGIDTSFKTLNSSLYTTISSTFTTLSNDYEKRLDQNREAHEKAVAALTEDLKKLKQNSSQMKDKKKGQQNKVIEQFKNIQNLKAKAKIFSRLHEYYYTKKSRKIRGEIILNHYANRRKFLIFNSWRNVCNSLLKGKIKLKYTEIYNKQYNKLNGEFDQEMARLKEILENLEHDIQKEIDERKNLSKLYDLSMKKGAEQFLKETNYIIDFNPSTVPTPNERSFAEK